MLLWHTYLFMHNAIIYIRCIVTDRVYPKLDCIQNIPKNEFYEKHCDCSTMLKHTFYYATICKFLKLGCQ